MTNKEDAMSEDDLKRHWYNRWKDGFSWLNMACTLKMSADFIHAEYLKGNQRYLLNFNSGAKFEGNTIKIRADSSSLGDSKTGLYPIYLSQVGYALENLFKGIIITGMWLNNNQSIDGVDDFRQLKFSVKGSMTHPIPAKTHELDALVGAEYMNLSFRNERQKVLIKIKEFILWGGRYPIPLSVDTGAPIFMRVLPPIDEPEEHIAIEEMYCACKQELSRLSAIQRDLRP